ncbi:MAG: hypothetical protein KW788_02080 [Candidatus Doudnabacteria bacterium]|nr:hypothetical protein [Candidatus Doudnabacteria bacterium]
MILAAACAGIGIIFLVVPELSVWCRVLGIVYIILAIATAVAAVSEAKRGGR